MRNFNINQTYIDKDDPWTGILSSTGFALHSTKNGLNGYSPGQFVFDRDTIILIKHKVDWELIFQRNQRQINKDNMRENIKIVDYDYNVGDKFILNNHAAKNMKTHIREYF